MHPCCQEEKKKLNFKKVTKKKPPKSAFSSGSGKLGRVPELPWRDSNVKKFSKFQKNFTDFLWWFG